MLSQGARAGLEAARLALPVGAVGRRGRAAGRAGRAAPGRAQGRRTRPTDDAERLAFAQMCYDTKRYAAAARFWAEALEADPKLGDDRQAAAPLQRRLRRRPGRRRPGQGRPAARRRRQGQAPRPGPRLAQGRAGRLGEGPRIRPARRPGRSSCRRSSTGRPTPTWPASATPTPWPSSPRPSARSGKGSGPRSRLAPTGRGQAP